MIERQWVEQPHGTRLCGQVAVAVIVGCSLDEAIEAVGHRKGTRTVGLAHALRKFGYSALGRARAKRTPPPLALGQLRSPGQSSWHWVVIDGEKVWDGAYGQPDGTVSWPSDARVTSYVPVFGPRQDVRG